MLIRAVRHEVEALLLAPSGARRGKSEYKIYGNGERRLRVALRPSGPLAGLTLTIAIAGRECARLAPAKMAAGYDVRSSRGDIVPEPHVGETIEVRIDGVLMASGVYEPD